MKCYNLGCNHHKDGKCSGQKEDTFRVFPEDVQIDSNGNCITLVPEDKDAQLAKLKKDNALLEKALEWQVINGIDTCHESEDGADCDESQPGCTECSIAYAKSQAKKESEESGR